MAGIDVRDAVYGSQRYGDVDGDGRADTCAVVGGLVKCGISDGNEFRDADGYTNDLLLGVDPFDDSARSLTLIDLDHDGRLDLCAAPADGIRCTLSEGTGRGEQLFVASDIPPRSGLVASPLHATREIESPAADIENPIVLENRHAGTQGWWVPVAQQHATVELEAYADQLSYAPGETISVAISTRMDSAVRWQLLRTGYYGGVGARRISQGGVRSMAQPRPDRVTWDQPASVAWATTLQVPLAPDVVSGVYALRLDAVEAKATYFVTVVVRDDNRFTDLVVQRSDFTDATYNTWDGGDHTQGAYTGATGSVSLDRPLVSPDQYGGNRTFSAGYFTFEFPMVRFIESQGYDVKYVSSSDVDRSVDAVLHTRAFLSVGHDEYWTAAMRDHIEEAAMAGVHLGFFSGDAVDGEIEFTDVRHRQFSVLTHAGKRKWADKTVDATRPAHDHPSDTLMGTHYLGWCGQVDKGSCSTSRLGKLTTSKSYILEPIVHPSLRDLDRSVVALPHVVGYEYATISADPSVLPANPVIIARAPSVRISGATAVMVAFQRQSGARVFNTGSVNWAHGLDDFSGRSQFRENPQSAMRLCRDSELDDLQCFRNTSNAVRQLTTTVLTDFGARPQLPSSLLRYGATCDWNQPSPACVDRP